MLHCISQILFFLIYFPCDYYTDYTLKDPCPASLYVFNFFPADSASHSNNNKVCHLPVKELLLYTVDTTRISLFHGDYFDFDRSIQKIREEAVIWN